MKEKGKEGAEIYKKEQSMVLGDDRKEKGRRRMAYLTWQTLPNWFKCLDWPPFPTVPIIPKLRSFAMRLYNSALPTLALFGPTEEATVTSAKHPQRQQPTFHLLETLCKPVAEASSLQAPPTDNPPAFY